MDNVFHFCVMSHFFLRMYLGNRKKTTESFLGDQMGQIKLICAHCSYIMLTLNEIQTLVFSNRNGSKMRYTDYARKLHRKDKIRVQTEVLS